MRQLLFITQLCVLLIYILCILIPLVYYNHPQFTPIYCHLQLLIIQSGSVRFQRVQVPLWG